MVALFFTIDIFHLANDQISLDWESVTLPPPPGYGKQPQDGGTTDGLTTPTLGRTQPSDSALSSDDLNMPPPLKFENPPSAMRGRSTAGPPPPKQVRFSRFSYPTNADKAPRSTMVETTEDVSTTWQDYVLNSDHRIIADSVFEWNDNDVPDGLSEGDFDIKARNAILRGSWNKTDPKEHGDYFVVTSGRVTGVHKGWYGVFFVHARTTA